MKLDDVNEFDISCGSPETMFRNAASRLLSEYWLASPSDQSEMEALWSKYWALVRDAGRQAAVREIPITLWLSLCRKIAIDNGVSVFKIKKTDENLVARLEEIKEIVERGIQEKVAQLGGKIQPPSPSIWRHELYLRTIAGNWRPISCTLLPGRIVPADGSRDDDIAIDAEFHRAELPVLRDLGVVDAPAACYELSPVLLYDFLIRRREEYCERPDLEQKPRPDKLNFANITTSGPLDVLEELSEEGMARYTWHLLALDDTFKRWTLRHDNPSYPPMDFESPALEVLREHGRIGTEAGIRRLSAGLGLDPADPDVLKHLLQHPKARLIRHAFDLEPASDPTLEPSGEDDPIPLLDFWPGLRPHLSQKEANFQLIRCDDLKNRTGRIDGTITDCGVYIARRDDDREELRVVLRELGLQLTEEQAEEVARRETPADIRAARDAIRACPTDEERLLAAVGEDELIDGLPKSLVNVLEQNHEALSGEQIAQAAIATYHTGALRVYRHALEKFHPPKQWAGGPQIVDFVRSLGFGEEWAGERNARRDPYIEVEGPYSLPPLHGYQRKVVGKVRGLMQSDGVASERRGMISMPTGSGKTRVAVQAIVEAIRCDGFRGGVLWVADRDELCEQAVESWRQVWSSEGKEGTRLRVSRMWAGQPQPSPTAEMHVIVATIQTLEKKLNGQQDSYEFLADFALVVFDEAHRSVARTYTSVMQELGLTRWRRAHEPILIGLTATPYRGHDEEETARLVRRYGSNRLDSGAFASDDPEEVIQELQGEGILAQAEHATIEGGRFFLYEDELRQSKVTPWLPQSVENRIAEDTERTLRIVAAYNDHIDPDWPTLIFATSVEHSQTVAALLTSKGVRARAVSANTDTVSRRRIVEEFREGDIKALVNYGIFREGFDAPKTRAIIVARPVYSPNLYFQMIGRGLRGTRNGGNDRCLILNVEDNIENFQRKLAFSDLDWLWA